ncbi:vicilin-like seed storage protein At2g18540 [Benincasa hispida]|uniref:vicilin-like seed storage protein At2g18540 n=1 Tax=Benincasa hispida TaxID=102211 RepID=UPI001902A37B|nr:vicilin-like seed storage protein At2g18540 [Benincasa hispida]
MNEKKERGREERRLKKEEERRKRVASLELDEESTFIREDKGESAQLREPAHLETMQMVATDEGEKGDTTPLMRHRKENVPQGSRRKRLQDEEVRRNNEISRVKEIRKLEEEQCLLLASDKFEKEFEIEEREEAEEKNKKAEGEKKKKDEKKKKRQANVQRLTRKKGKELAEREKEEQRKERERKRRQKSRLALTKEKGKVVVENNKPALAKGRPSRKKENDDLLIEMGFFPVPTPLPDLITSMIVERGWDTFFQCIEEEPMAEVHGLINVKILRLLLKDSPHYPELPLKRPNIDLNAPQEPKPKKQRRDDKGKEKI